MSNVCSAHCISNQVLWSWKTATRGQLWGSGFCLVSPCLISSLLQHQSRDVGADSQTANQMSAAEGDELASQNGSVALKYFELKQVILRKNKSFAKLHENCLGLMWPQRIPVLVHNQLRNLNRHRTVRTKHYIAVFLGYISTIDIQQHISHILFINVRSGRQTRTFHFFDQSHPLMWQYCKDNFW